MSTTTDNWRDTCQQCGADLPLDAPSYQKFCSHECRFKAYEKYQIQNREDQNARRRQSRLEAKMNRPPCEECGKDIPLTLNSSARFCCEICGRKNYTRRRTDWKKFRQARLAERARQRAERRANGSATRHS